jgi:tripartite ATP-independent transporter DctM subunit
MLVMGILFFVTLIIGMPIAFSLGVTTLAGVLLMEDIPLTILPQKMFTGVDFFSLVAIPFFILAGELMNHGKITDALVAFAQQIVGRFRGGLAHVNIVSAMFFSGITGSAVADASALGSLMIPAMEKEKYDRTFASAVVAAAAVMGPIIPPSIIMVVYALVDGNVSIGALFMAGYIPGILIGGLQMVTAYIIASRRNYPRLNEPFSFPVFLGRFKDALLPLLTPVIIMGGILGGVFTPTEAAAIACLYAFLVGFFFFKTLEIRTLPKLLYNTVLTTAMVFLIFCMGQVLVALLTINQVPQKITEFMLSISSNPLFFLFLVNILLLIVGCFIESGVAIIVLVPILAPVALKLGIDPLHFATVVVVNLCLGLLTPPMGVVLFVVCGIAKISLEEITKAIWPFMLAILIVLFLITYIPSLTLVIPRYFGF